MLPVLLPLFQLHGVPAQLLAHQRCCRIPMCLAPAPSMPCRATFDPDTIRSRLRELAFLNSRATIFFRAPDGKPVKTSSRNSSSSGAVAAEAGGNGVPVAVDATLSPVAAAVAAEGWEVFHASGGLAEYVRFLNRDKEAIHEPIVFSKQVGRVGCPG